MTDRDRLIELLNVDMSGCDGDYAEEMTDYLIANGVICPPSKPGDIIYFIRESGKAESFGDEYVDWITVGRICVTAYGITIHGSNAFADMIFNAKGIGTVCFLTREEAEKALEERKEKRK